MKVSPEHEIKSLVIQVVSGGASAQNQKTDHKLFEVDHSILFEGKNR